MHFALEMISYPACMRGMVQRAGFNMSRPHARSVKAHETALVGGLFSADIEAERYTWL